MNGTTTAYVTSGVPANRWQGGIPQKTKAAATGVMVTKQHGSVASFERRGMEARLRIYPGRDSCGVGPQFGVSMQIV